MLSKSNSLWVPYMPTMGFEPMTSRLLRKCSTNSRSFCEITRLVFVCAYSIVILCVVGLLVITLTSRPLCNWIASRLVCKINAGATVVTWGEKSNISMVRRRSQSVPARPNQRSYSWHIADWETEVGLIRALRLWQQSVAQHKRLRGKRKWKKQEPKLSACLFIQKEEEARLGTIWNGLAWKEFLERLQREQLKIRRDHWVAWSGQTFRSICALRRFAASTLLTNEDCLLDLRILRERRNFLRRVHVCHLEVFNKRWVIWSGLVAKYHRIRKQVVAAQSVPAGRLKRSRTTRG